MVCSIVKPPTEAAPPVCRRLVSERCRERGKRVSIVSIRPDSPPGAVNVSPKKKPQPFRAGALRCRRGGGRGCRSPRGVRAERRPRLGVPKKMKGRPDKRNAPECVPRRFADSCRSRRLSPVPAPLLPQKSDSEKRLRGRPRPIPTLLPLTISRVWTAGSARANLPAGQKKSG